MSLTSQTVKELLNSQLEVWDMAKNNYEALAGVKTKEFTFDGFTVYVQFNPARIQSSAAKVDPKSIQERKCFLCTANLPEVQKGIPFGSEYQVLLNPFPIFPEHFTIPTYEHTDQLIVDRYGDMLDLAKNIDSYTIFYNGPKCGASAPDHAHFQAGNKGFLPIEKDVKNINKESVYKSKDVEVFTFNNYLRNGFLIVSEDRNASMNMFRKIYDLLEIKDGEKEPMLNLLVWYENGKWYTCIFPRETHRPACFYAEGDNNILISPASVDLGGVFITPLEKDFDKITAEDISSIIKEITISDEKMEEIVNKLNN